MKFRKLLSLAAALVCLSAPAYAQSVDRGGLVQNYPYPDPSNALVVSGTSGFSLSAVGYLTSGGVDSRGFAVSGFSNVSVALTGTYVGVTLNEEQTNDVTGQTGWYPVLCNDGTSTGSTTGTNYVCPVFGVRHRLRVSAYTSGTINARVVLNKYSTLAAYNGSAAKFSSLTVSGLISALSNIDMVNTTISRVNSLRFGTNSATILQQDADNVFALRNGVTAQTFNIYNTFTDASNYERGMLGWGGTANEFWVTNQAAGTGSPRVMRVFSGSTLNLGSDGTSNRWLIQGGHFLAGTDNTYDIGASGANRPRNVYVAGSVFINSFLNFVSASKITSPVDGNMLIQNNGGSGFGCLQFGGATSSFSAWCLSGTTLKARLADNSADAPISAAGATFSGSIVAGTDNTYDFGTLANRFATGYVHYVNTKPKTVSTLTTCTSGNDGMRGFVTDATVTTFASAVAGSGTNHVPVYCDGSGTPTWKIG